MISEERERLARVETEMSGVKDDLAEVKADVKQLLAAANMGKGAYWTMVKIGGVLLLAVNAAVWLFDKLKPLS